MGKIQVETCPIEGLKIITPTVFGDKRGYFMETYNYNDFKEAGIDISRIVIRRLRLSGWSVGKYLTWR